MPKDTKPATKPALSQEAKTHIETKFNQGHITPHNWRHVALDLADELCVDFHDVEAYVRKLMHQ